MIECSSFFSDFSVSYSPPPRSSHLRLLCRPLRLWSPRLRETSAPPGHQARVLATWPRAPLIPGDLRCTHCPLAWERRRTWSQRKLGSRPSLNWLETFSTNYRISFELITWERLDQFRHLTSLLPGLPLPRSRYSLRQWWRGLGDQGTGHMQPGQHCAPSEQRPPEKLRSWYYG